MLPKFCVERFTYINIFCFTLLENRSFLNNQRIQENALQIQFYQTYPPTHPLTLFI